MSNPISQLSGRSDLNRPVSRISPRTLQGPAPVAPVSELPAVNTVPQTSFDPRSMDSVETAFPSLEVITRRILQGMQNAMERAIEEAAREAIESQRAQRASDAERAREAKLDDILAELSRDIPTEEVKKSDAVRGQTASGTAQTNTLGADLPGDATGSAPTADTVTLVGSGGDAPPAAANGSVAPPTLGSNSALESVGGETQQPALTRDSAAALLGDVVKAVRETPRKDAGQLHRSENLAYSAVLLNA